jgi:hypothetical protein
MAELKTKKTELSVDKFINSIKDEQKRKDSFAIVEMMKKATKSEPKMWGSAIIGFGDHVLKYENGRELDWFKIGFSPRKANLTLYIGGAAEKQKASFAKLGKYKTSGGCVYLNKLENVDVKVLKSIIENHVKAIK